MKNLLANVNIILDKMAIIIISGDFNGCSQIYLDERKICGMG